MKKTKIRGAFARFMAHYLETTKSGIVESLLVRPVIYPSGKPRIPHLLRYQGFGVKVLQPHPRCLGSAASSTFATLGFSDLSAGAFLAPSAFSRKRELRSPPRISHKNTAPSRQSLQKRHHSALSGVSGNSTSRISTTPCDHLFFSGSFLCH